MNRQETVLESRMRGNKSQKKSARLLEYILHHQKNKSGRIIANDGNRGTLCRINTDHPFIPRIPLQSTNRKARRRPSTHTKRGINKINIREVRKEWKRGDCQRLILGVEKVRPRIFSVYSRAIIGGIPELSLWNSKLWEPSSGNIYSYILRVTLQKLTSADSLNSWSAGAVACEGGRGWRVGRGQWGYRGSIS